jgi:hypothetical protein
LEDVPLDYLLWCLRQEDFRPAWLRGAIEREVERPGNSRGAQGCPGNSAGQSRLLDTAALRAILKSWFAQLSRDWHPERRDGDNRPMAALNDGYERLRKILGI